ncbi:type VII secretion protein EccB [Dactylosporangium sp. NBC_01737]|uniref:type VII secretion protein EccB n=1 Tax=Dactylosporangium sp. NBC_01737 TaxID=2975959 RepID=UPI002E0D668C|nr:type VII secretion protein EccB [Dactylosporangium sp. NBC_01737]
MVARYEQVRAYRFVTRRIVSAMLSGEPESNELPVRRLGMSLFGSLLVGMIVLAVVGVYGFINPSGGKPAENDIVIERESGARYVFIEGRLHPVLNFTSARLIVGSPSPKVRTMSHKSLVNLPVGPPVGIRDAPDPPPPKNTLLGLPWNVCGVRVTGAGAAATQLVIGRTPSGGVPLGEEALLVSTSAGNDLPLYLLWHDHRLRIADRTTLTALELASVTPTQIDRALLDAVAAGPDLTALRIPGAGQPSPKKIAGASPEIGAVYRSGQQFYVVTRSGLNAIGAVSAALLTANGKPAVEISATQAGEVYNNTPVEPEGFPKAKPPVRSAGTDTTFCAQFGTAGISGQQAPALSVYPPGSEQLQLDPDRSAVSGGTTADQVTLPEGRGALAQALPGTESQPTGTVYLITDQGIRYPLQDSGQVKAMAALGYEGVTPVGVPSSLLALVPTGPTLDPEVARKFVGSVTPAATPTKAPAPASSTSKPPSSAPPTPTKAPSSPAGSRSGRRAPQARRGTRP